MVQHAALTDTELHYPRGASQAGVALDLASSATAYQITDASAHGYLTINTSDSPPTIVWGNTSGDANAQPTYRYYLPDNVSNAWRVSDEGALDYVSVTTTNGSEMITLGNATTNPKLTWTGSGAWSVGGGYGTSGYVLTSNGSSAAPTWQSVTSAATSSGTSADSFEVNNDASLAVSATTGSLTISSNDGAGSPTAWSTTLTQATSGPLVLSTVANGVNTAPTVILGLDSTSAAATSVLKLSAASGGTQRTASLTWTASTQVLTVSPVTSFSLAPTAPGGSSSERWGASASAPGTNCTAVGQGAIAGATASAGDGSVAVGTSANVNTHRSVGVGWGATASANDAIAIGRASSCAGAFGLAAGSGATANGASVVLCGSDGATPGRFVVGGQLPITQVLIGNGESVATPGAITYRTTDASGTDHAGADWTFDGSKGTGNAQGGYIRLRAAVSAGVSGSTAGTLTEVLRVDGGAAGGRVGFFGVTPSARVATPATLGDVIALLQAYGLAS